MYRIQYFNDISCCNLTDSTFQQVVYLMMHINTHVCVCVYACLCACMRVCVCIPRDPYFCPGRVYCVL